MLKINDIKRHRSFEHRFIELFNGSFYYQRTTLCDYYYRNDKTRTFVYNRYNVTVLLYIADIGYVNVDELKLIISKYTCYNCNVVIIINKISSDDFQDYCHKKHIITKL